MSSKKNHINLRTRTRTCKGHKATSVEWNITVEHSAHAVDNSGVYDRRRCVEIISNLGSGALEIEYGRTILFIDLDPELDLSASQLSTIIIRENILTGVPSSK